MSFDPFSPRISNPVGYRASLLCDTIVVPTVPYFAGSNAFLRQKWQEAGEALANQQGSRACQIFLSTAEQTLASGSALPAFLFNAAHSLMAVKCQTAADHCIQRGLTLLTGRSDARGAFSGPLWLVMASSALIREDLESCGVWLRQARQSLLHANANKRRLSQNLQRWIGDCFAIEACLEAGTGHLVKAEILLSEAHRSHMRARAFTSAAKDLILRSRGRMFEQRWEAAESDLIDAQAFIQPGTPAEDDHQRGNLGGAIDIGLRTVRSTSGALMAAKWN